MQAKTEHFDDILKVNTNCTYNSTGKLGRFLVEPGHLEKQAETFRIC